MSRERSNVSRMFIAQAWYTGQRAERIPSGLVRVVGNDCVSLDLSYNELTSVSSARDYVHLRELILDNNKLRDLKTLPFMPSLTTLSLNNNKVVACDCEEVLRQVYTSGRDVNAGKSFYWPAGAGGGGEDIIES